jgi:hypothetical protein
LGIDKKEVILSHRSSIAMPAGLRRFLVRAVAIVAWLMPLATGMVAEAKQDIQFPDTFQHPPMCWHYVNSDQEEGGVSNVDIDGNNTL